MGIVLTVVTVLVFVGVGALMKLVDKRRMADGVIQDKVVVRYIETGEVRGDSDASLVGFPATT